MRHLQRQVFGFLKPSRASSVPCRMALSMASLEKFSTDDGNVVKTADSSRPSRLDTLPAEIISRVMNFAMISDNPVYFWLFPDLARYFRASENFAGRPVTRQLSSQLIGGYSYSFDLPENQKEHLLDWRFATSTCHRLRLHAKPAFFDCKEFIIPTTMMQQLQNAEPRSSNVNLAKHCIQHIIVPIRNFGWGADFTVLPKYQFFERLSILTIRAPDDILRNVKEHPPGNIWPCEIPTELLELLLQMGMRTNKVSVKLLVIEENEEDVSRRIEIMERGVYPLLRISIQARSNSRNEVI